MCRPDAVLPGSFVGALGIHPACATGQSHAPETPIEYSRWQDTLTPKTVNALAYSVTVTGSWDGWRR